MRLSSREGEIALAIAHGHTTKWIGARLGLTTATVSWYIDRLMRRFDVSSRCELVAFLYGAGILTGYPAQFTRAV